jgi:two-component system, NarL family, response regulator NreC
MQQNVIRVMLVEDQTLIRKAFLALVKSHHPEWHVYEANDGAEAVIRAKEFQPNLILMDYRMPKMDGLLAAEIILQNFPETKIIMVSAEENNEFMFNAIDTGVSGIVPKMAPEEELMEAISTVIKGEIYLNPLVSEKIAQYFYEKKKRRVIKRHHASPIFSDRELEILRLIVQGHSSPKIADLLFISKRTVESHRANIIKKCQVSSTADLIRFAIANKMIEL